MKKKFIVLAIIILTMAILYIIIVNRKSNKKIYSYSSSGKGIVINYTNIDIYNNGLIKKKEKIYKNPKEVDTKKELSKELSKEELSELKKLIIKVENCDLNKVSLDEYNYFPGFSSSSYINLNKKIILEDDKYTYNNKEVEALKELISKIESKCFD